MRLNFITSSSEQTKEIGRKLSGFLSAGDVIFFLGELGGGKTTFISGIAEGLAIKENMSSPSFTLMNIYDFNKNGADLKLVHCDFYRIDSLKDITDTGIEEYLYDSKTVTLIEWGSLVKEIVCKKFLEIKFEYFFEDIVSGKNFDGINQKRKITFAASDAYWISKIEMLKNTMFV
ncbi:MAG: tRNA (adenosine(37)-N6)-threonylcarbamoyltransferase complex ATPase subunit type 1 TsaE [Actinomycetota bacterium]|nr:tRNA (adenosine(37)-N6)-threonylcarbamoyltransferase complex ATPase subunit type 1 TsaE [Actinomycetota bacterium]